jgi:hypothetical protein
LAWSISDFTSFVALIDRFNGSKLNIRRQSARYQNSDRENGSQQTASSANQSAIFAFSAGKTKIALVFAHFLLPEGPEKAQIRPSAGDSCSILSVENRAGALLAVRLAASAEKMIKSSDCAAALLLAALSPPEAGG